MKLMIIMLHLKYKCINCLMPIILISLFRLVLRKYHCFLRASLLRGLPKGWVGGFEDWLRLWVGSFKKSFAYNFKCIEL